VTEEDPILVEVVRDGFVESIHRGRAIGLAGDGTIGLGVGLVHEPVLLRSCAKLLQAVGMVRAGLDADGEWLALVAASHAGTARHLAVVEALLASVGLDEAALANTPDFALDPRAAAEQRLAGGPDRLHQNCSGKHAGMLATCVANGWSLDGYLDHEHPLQRALLAAMTDLTGEPAAHVATDGCGAPVVATTIGGLALAFARIATGAPGSAEGRVGAAVRDHPELVGGEGRDVTRLMRAIPGLVAKDGAEGCFAAALPDGRSVAVKVADGAGRAAAPLAIAALASLGVDVGGAGDLAAPPVLGHGRPVGALRTRLA
jgi:L-asparaginase II